MIQIKYGECCLDKTIKFGILTQCCWLIFFWKIEEMFRSHKKCQKKKKKRRRKLRASLLFPFVLKCKPFLPSCLLLILSFSIDYISKLERCLLGCWRLERCLLGVEIDCQIKFKEHMPTFCSKAAMYLNTICRLQRFLNKTKKML